MSESEAVSPIRVLHVLPYFPPERIGGVGEIAAHLHEGLLERGHDSQVLTAGRRGTDPRVHRIGESAMGFVTGCARHVGRARDRDVVHLHTGDAAFFLLAMATRRLPAARLASFHVDNRAMAASLRGHRVEGIRFGAGPGRRLLERVQAEAHSGLDALARSLAGESVYFSRSAARDVLGVRGAGQARIIRDGLPPLVESQDELSAVPVELLYVGVFGQRKRTHLLPFVLREVRRVHARARLRVVGATAAQQPELAALFQRLGLDGAVQWQGALPSREIRAHYRAAQVLLLPSAYEGLPTVILEAMQCGLPCVATRVCGHPEVIEDGGNGYLVAPDRPGEMAKRACGLLADAEQRSRLGSAARAVIARHFGLEAMLVAYENLYRELLSRRRKLLGPRK